MKLQMLLLLINIWITVTKCQKLQEYQFLPQFQSPGAPVFGSDSSIYLPPETHTSAPYEPINTVNRISFPFLPSTETKVPNKFPTPFQILVSSTLSPNFNEDNEKNGANENDRRNFLNSIQQKTTNLSMDQQPNINHKENNDFKSISRSTRLQRPIDIKFPQFSERFKLSRIPTANPTPASRRNNIATEIKLTDQGIELDKSSSILSPHYIHASNYFISSTTETAIPIIRLSNEMDLDGSFSYEALGADQTHFVQHSRMENHGSDKDEQVVEGSYSYIGDDGQTYTVHYVADSNGFRASGDHLPVAPPIPEIIQRSVQYNLAEEAKKPPHLRWSWSDEDKNQEIDEINKENSHSFNASPPQRNNLFTGRTPEAFSFSYPQNINFQNNDNNIVAAASSVQTINSKINHAKNFSHSKSELDRNTNNLPIVPQVTFLASQGAHVPSLSDNYQSIAKLLSNEKSQMPQIVNYEADVKQLDQSNKDLWRWQYGHNNMNYTPNKNTISRSSAGDEVMMNFNDMTAQQYSNVFHSKSHDIPDTLPQINYDEPHFFAPNNKENKSKSDNQTFGQHNSNIHFPIVTKPQEAPTTTEYTIVYRSTQQPYIKQYNEYLGSTTKEPASSNVSQFSYLFPHYEEFEDKFYDSMRTPTANNTNTVNNQLKTGVSKIGNNYFDDYSPYQDKTTDSPPETSTFSSVPVLQSNYNDGFKPIMQNTEAITAESTTETFEKMLENNIFLKSLLNTGKKENQARNEPVKFHPAQLDSDIRPEPKTEKSSKFIQIQPKTANDLILFKRKPLDAADILNFVSLKDHFESNKIKIKPKSSLILRNQYNDSKSLSLRKKINENVSENIDNSSQTSNDFQNQWDKENRSIIKNYKVMHRNNNIMNIDQNNNERVLKQDFYQHKYNWQPNLPPLGRAGPSIKNYFPPTYV